MTKSELCFVMSDKKKATEHYRQTSLTQMITKTALDGFHDMLFEYPRGVDGSYLIEILTLDGYAVEKLNYGLRVIWGDCE